MAAAAVYLLKRNKISRRAHKQARTVGSRRKGVTILMSPSRVHACKDIHAAKQAARAAGAAALKQVEEAAENLFNSPPLSGGADVDAIFDLEEGFTGPSDDAPAAFGALTGVLRLCSGKTHGSEVLRELEEFCGKLVARVVSQHAGCSWCLDYIQSIESSAHHAETQLAGADWGEGEDSEWDDEEETAGRHPTPASAAGSSNSKTAPASRPPRAKRGTAQLDARRVVSQLCSSRRRIVAGMSSWLHYEAMRTGEPACGAVILGQGSGWGTRVLLFGDIPGATAKDSNAKPGTEGGTLQHSELQRSLTKAFDAGVEGRSLVVAALERTRSPAELARASAVHAGLGIYLPSPAASTLSSQCDGTETGDGDEPTVSSPPPTPPRRGASQRQPRVSTSSVSSVGSSDITVGGSVGTTTGGEQQGRGGRGRSTAGPGRGRGASTTSGRGGKK